MTDIILSMGTKLDRNCGKQLRKTLKSVLCQSKTVCFDASALQLADATGLAELFALIAGILERGGEAIVAGASDSMLAIFELVQLDQVAEMSEAWQNSALTRICASLPAELPSIAGGLQDQMAS
jgi:anti-anti-sigma regulatory factor